MIINVKIKQRKQYTIQYNQNKTIKTVSLTNHSVYFKKYSIEIFLILGSIFFNIFLYNIFYYIDQYDVDIRSLK